MPVLLGCAASDITPQKPVPLSGFGFRHGNFDSVYGPLFLKCFVFRYAEKDLVVFSADILCWGRDSTDHIKKLLEKEYPRRADFLFLATHTHCGPSMTRLFFAGIGDGDDEYIAWAAEKTVKTALEAAECFRPVKASVHSGKTAIGINRRLKTGKVVSMAPNPEGPRDDEIKLVEFTACENDALFKTGDPVAVWACVSCHPTATAEKRVDREFFARGLDYYLDSRAPRATGALLEGCCGDVRPAMIRDGAFFRGTLDRESDELARRFSGELSAAKNSPGISLNLNESACFSTHLAELPYNPDFPHRDRLALLRKSAGDLQSEDVMVLSGGDEKINWAKHFRDTPVPAAMPLEIFSFNLAKEFGFIFFSAEVVCEYSLYCRKESGGRIWAGAYAGGMTTYIPTSVQLEEGGYESYECMFAFLQPAPFAGAVENILKEKIKSLVKA
ncbi:MAG: hypothetical protein LBP27_01865 [Treponema sp.]|jgi:hypothetical protein|nr:hypothetical protein [Treponema sp.]